MVKHIRLFLEDFKAMNADGNHEDQIMATPHSELLNVKKEERARKPEVLLCNWEKRRDVFEESDNGTVMFSVGGGSVRQVV